MDRTSPWTPHSGPGPKGHGDAAQDRAKTSNPVYDQWELSGSIGDTATGIVAIRALTTAQPSPLMRTMGRP